MSDQIDFQKYWTLLSSVREDVSTAIDLWGLSPDSFHLIRTLTYEERITRYLRNKKDLEDMCGPGASKGDFTPGILDTSLTYLLYAYDIKVKDIPSDESKGIGYNPAAA